MGNNTTLTEQEFQQIQEQEAITWNIEDPVKRTEKERREKARYPLLAKQMGLIGRYACIDTSDMLIWDIGAGPCGGVSSILPCKERLCIDPNMDAYSKYYNVSGYIGTKAEDLKESLSKPDLIISTNCIDHFHEPKQFLQDLVQYMKYGAFFCHFHAIDNAYQHKHPAHKHNLNEEIVGSILGEKFECVWGMNYKDDGLTYGWLKERSFCGLYRKIC
jgi:hypothetical protein